ncbi:hypothetical protein [Pseudomonas sp. RIT-PI-q]|uniref:hypothetical protein n=1 Tax=Pseudomonas sp. RIT-PI-q TaxID=1690247 RepID=UPI0007519A66|nr:hypothetical protein [Pseudomonas sp. RIT-PI-q]
MNYKCLDYIMQYNDKLSDHCDWMIQVCTEDQEEMEHCFRVYHVETDPAKHGEPKFIGYFPAAMPVELLISVASTWREYYCLGETVD